MPPAPVRVLIVDDHRLCRGDLARRLRAYPDLVLLGEARSGEEALVQVRQHQPEVVVLDLTMPGGSAAAATSALLAAYPATTICIVTQSEDDADLFACIRAGARGYVRHETASDALHTAILTLAAGGTVITPGLATQLVAAFARLSPDPRVPDGPGVDTLTPREREVLAYVAAGWRNQEIADQLGVAVNTVKVHLHNTMDKLAVRNRQQLAAVAARAGLVGPSTPPASGAGQRSAT